MSKIEQMQLKIAELLQTSEAAMTLVSSLTAERDELAAQLVAVKEGCGTGQSPCAKFCESVALRKDFDQLREHSDKMKVERDALAVQLAGVVDELQDFAAGLDSMLMGGVDADQIIDDLFSRISHYGVGGA